MKHPRRRLAAIVLTTAAALSASQTHTWSQGDYADFEKGVIKNLSVRSDGLLTLAPHSRELVDTSAPYLWALAQDSKGNLYTAGAGAKIFRVSPDGKTAEKPKPIADLDALGIQALAVDSRDRLYAATAPDGRIYRITGNAKPEVFYEPKAKYIWSMVFDGQGNLFVATGDPGAIDRVTPDGKGKVFFQTAETHVRSLALDANQNLIAGTDPGGLVLRVSPQGQGFVLYQMSKPEVTALAVGKNGSIYAAAVGTRGATAPAAPLPSPTTATVIVNTPGGAAPGGQAAPRPVAPPPSVGPAASVAGGSEVYEIDSTGYPMKIWSQSQDVVYAISFDADGRAILGAGNHGSVYRVDSPTRYTALLTMPATQVTAFQKGRDGKLYAATGNVGRVYEIGPGTEHDGTIESDVFDASLFSLWGRVSYEAHLNGGQVAIQTRSGNLDQPQENWSEWSAPIAGAKGAPVISPASRFVQWKATLTADSTGRTPELESVDVAYLAKNVAPQVERIEVTPANYKFPASIIPLVAATGPPPALILPPLGKGSSSGAAGSLGLETAGNAPSMSYAKGYIGARWSAMDANGDPLLYTVEIRGEKETEWKPLKQKIAERYLSWDSTAFPDGDYRLRVTVSDAPGNPPSDALTNAMASDPFTIDNTPPKITAVTATRNGGKLEVRWHAADALSNIVKAEYSLDGGEWTMAAPVTKLSDSMDLDYALALDAPAGEHTIAVRVFDDGDNFGVEKTVVK